MTELLLLIMEIYGPSKMPIPEDTKYDPIYFSNAYDNHRFGNAIEQETHDSETANLDKICKIQGSEEDLLHITLPTTSERPSHRPKSAIGSPSTFPKVPMLGGLFGKKPAMSIKIDGNPDLDSYRDRITTRKLPCFVPGDRVTGTLSIEPVPGKSLSHQGISLTLFCDYREKNGTNLVRFFDRKQFLTPAGELSVPINSTFAFDKLSFPTGSYYGQEFDAVYGIELRIIQRLRDTIETSEFLVFQFDDATENPAIHNEIGMTNVLHIEFIFPNSTFDCHGVVIGAGYLVLVKLSIVHMQISLYVSEKFDNGGKYVNKRTILKTCEVMDGPPCRGDHVPIRFYLGDCDVWPQPNVRGSPATVEFYLRAQLTDENGKRYYKRLRAKIMRVRDNSK